MAEKPWYSRHDITHSAEPAPMNTMGDLVKLIDHLLDLEQWRRMEWLREYPKDKDEIEASCTKRVSSLLWIRRYLDGLNAAFETEAERDLSVSLVLSGMAIHDAMTVWQTHLASIGQDKIEALAKHSKEREFSQTDWMQRKEIAEQAMAEVEADPENENKSKASLKQKAAAIVAVRLGKESLSVRQLEQYLKWTPEQ